MDDLAPAFFPISRGTFRKKAPPLLFCHDFCKATLDCSSWSPYRDARLLELSLELIKHVYRVAPPCRTALAHGKALPDYPSWLLYQGVLGRAPFRELQELAYIATRPCRTGLVRRKVNQDHSQPSPCPDGHDPELSRELKVIFYRAARQRCIAPV